MILGKSYIEQAIIQSLWTYHSYLDGQEPRIGQNSVDVRLAPFFLAPQKMPDGHVVDPYKPCTLPEYREVEALYYDLKPGEFVLGSASERIDCTAMLPEKWFEHYDPRYRNSTVDHGVAFCQHYDGRSTMGRLGILSHVSAGFGDFGFKGAFTLEIVNLSPNTIRLRSNMRIGQIYFTEVAGGGYDLYKGYDQTDFKPVAPIIGRDRF